MIEPARECLMKQHENRNLLGAAGYGSQAPTHGFGGYGLGFRVLGVGGSRVLVESLPVAAKSHGCEG